MKLKLNNKQVAGLWAILTQLKLGKDNKFVDAVSDLVIEMDNKGAQDIYNEFEGAPYLRVQVDFEDGSHLELREGISGW